MEKKLKADFKIVKVKVKVNVKKYEPKTQTSHNIHPRGARAASGKMQSIE